MEIRDVYVNYILTENELRIEQTFHNLSASAMPIYAGFHPYFAMKNKVMNLETDATTYLDYNDNQVKAFNGTINMEGLDEAVVLLDAQETKLAALWNESKQIVIETGQEFAYMVLWTQVEKDFVCIEPWMAKTGEFHRKEEL